MKTGTYGWKSVFAFTFRQTAKSKAFKVSSVIIIVLVFAIALLAGVLPALIGSRSTSDDGDITGDGEALVGTVYFADTTGITTGKDYEGFLSGLGVKINDCGKDADIQSLTERVKGENKSLLIVNQGKTKSGMIFTHHVRMMNRCHRVRRTASVKPLKAFLTA